MADRYHFEAMDSDMIIRGLIFIGSYLVLYSLLHWLLWFPVRPLLPAGRGAVWAYVVICGVMILLPVAARVLEGVGSHGLADICSWIGYIWMGLIMIALPLDLVLWLARKSAGLMGLGGGVAWWSAAWLAVVLLVSGYAVYEAETLRLERITIQSADLPPALDGLKIMQISDLHLGAMASLSRVERVAALCAREKPDLLVSTGDLVDGMLDGSGAFVPALAGMRARLGKYAVTGNHERYMGARQSLDFTRLAGFTLLRGQEVAPAPGLVLAGVDDPAFPAKDQEAALLARTPQDAFLVLLKHRPEVAPGSLGKVDLQLSGHAHRGQIFPYNLLVGLVYPKNDGLYVLDGGTCLYTSRGTGSWGPPMRLLAPPELTVITLRKKGGD